ncbi:MAG: hypothetical protein FWB80_12070 [Defluviitaleaceae bacterium]|nr:hypothetical protein [Defluviitaleaceae bacterium]
MITATQLHMATEEESKLHAEKKAVRIYNIGGKEYAVRSFFKDSQDITTALINLAVRRALFDMGFDCQR